MVGFWLVLGWFGLPWFPPPFVFPIGCSLVSLVSSLVSLLFSLGSLGFLGFLIGFRGGVAIGCLVHGVIGSGVAASVFKWGHGVHGGAFTGFTGLHGGHWVHHWFPSLVSIGFIIGFIGFIKLGVHGGSSCGFMGFIG